MSHELKVQIFDKKKKPTNLPTA